MTHPRKSIEARRRRLKRRRMKLRRASKAIIAGELERLMGEVLKTRDMLVADGLMTHGGSL